MGWHCALPSFCRSGASGRNGAAVSTVSCTKINAMPPGQPGGQVRRKRLPCAQKSPDHQGVPNWPAGAVPARLTVCRTVVQAPVNPDAPNRGCAWENPCGSVFEMQAVLAPWQRGGKGFAGCWWQHANVPWQRRSWCVRGAMPLLERYQDQAVLFPVHRLPRGKMQEKAKSEVAATSAAACEGDGPASWRSEQ